MNSEEEGKRDTKVMKVVKLLLTVSIVSIFLTICCAVIESLLTFNNRSITETVAQVFFTVSIVTGTGAGFTALIRQILK